MITHFKIFENKFDYIFFHENIKDGALTSEDRIKFVKQYIADGKDVNISTSTNITILMISVHFGRVDEVKLLIDAGADVNIKTEWGDTALIWWSLNKSILDNYENYNDILKYLLDAGAKITISDKGKDLFSYDKDGSIKKYVIDNYPEQYKEYIKLKKIKKFKI